MKQILLLLFASCSFCLFGQTYYGYDNSGHRVSRTITMPSNAMPTSSDSLDLVETFIDNSLELKDQVGQFEFSIFPNPTKGEIHIKSATETEGMIYLYDMQGKIIYQYKGKLGDNKVDLYQQKRGLYMLKISSDGQDVTWKIVKE